MRRIIRVREVPVYVEERPSRYGPSGTFYSDDSDEEEARASGRRPPASRKIINRREPPLKNEVQSAVRVSGGYRYFGEQNQRSRRVHARRVSSSGSDSSSDEDRHPRPRPKVVRKKKPVQATRKPPEKKTPVRDTKLNERKRTASTPKGKDYKDEPLHYDGNGVDGLYARYPFPQVWYHHPPPCDCRPRALSRLHRSKSANRTNTASASSSMGLLIKDFSRLNDAALQQLTLLAGRGLTEALSDED